MDMSDREKDIRFGQIMDKLQKLTGALYRITDLMSDKEPLKWGLRERAYNLYQKLSSLRYFELITQGEKNTLFQQAVSEINQINGILGIVSLGGYISNLNFEVIKREYINFEAFLNGQKDNILEDQKLLLDTNIFSPIKKEKASIGQGYNGQMSDKTMSNREVSDRKSSGFSVKKDNSERKEKIKEFLKMNGSQTIGGIHAQFEGVSEKSIQRDLSDLVKNGHLFAEGEKRWRKYKVV